LSLSNTTPENYLQLVQDVVDALGRAENNQLLQFNEIQCRLLKQKLQETVTPLLSRVDKDSLPPEKQALFERRCRGAALLEFYRIVKHAEAIIHGCSTQEWLKAAIMLANSFEAFVNIFFKLDWCAAVVGIVFSNALTSERQDDPDNIEGFGEAECTRRTEEIRSMLQQPASQDRDSLRRRLTEMQEDTGPRNNHEIVAYLLELATTDPANMEQTTVDLLPIIKRKNLRHGRYLGKGAFGEVVQVEWLDQKVAQKIFRSVDSRSFRVEANILAGLCHPNIVQIFGVCTGGRECSILMELMHGDLFRAINDVFARSTSTSYHREQSFELPVALPVALDIMLQMAEAMQYLHRKKITHRDLKSLNMLIKTAQIPEIAEAGYMDVKVADFGTSKIFNATSTFSPLSMVGTRAWMAPEIGCKPEEDSRTMKYYPFKSDVYSFAITCSEILSGLTPFEGIPRATLAEEVRAGLRPSLPNSLPISLSSLIKCCWDGDVRRRPSFSRICTQLRHLKGMYLINGKYSCN
jgi:tRNA A-37 threonylcarbamoyl transferase component Bud32